MKDCQIDALKFAAWGRGAFPRARASKLSWAIRSYRALERRGLVREVGTVDDYFGVERVHFVATEAGCLIYNNLSNKMSAEILIVGSGGTTSEDLVFNGGDRMAVRLIDADPKALVRILYKIGDDFIETGELRGRDDAVLRVMNIAGTYRFERRAGGSCGVQVVGSWEQKAF